MALPWPSQTRRQTTATDQPQPRTITVNGNGKAYLTPDIVHIYIGVHTENKDASTGRDR